MQRYFIINGTITNAIKCRDLLRKNGYSAELKRTVNVGGNVGCGYGVVTVCDISEVEKILLQHNIRYLQIKKEGD